MSYALAVFAVIAAGLLGLSLVGKPCAIAGGIALVATLFAPLLHRRASTRTSLTINRVPWPLLTLSVVSLLSIAVIWGVPAAEALGILLAYLQIHNRLGRLHTADDRTAVVLAVLMLAIGASATRDPLFLVSIVLLSAALPVALAGELRPRGALAIALANLSLSAMLFLAAPRARLYIDDASELTGFSPEVELGVLDTLFDDPTEVFRAAVRPIPEDVIYWRGLALDRFDGTRWSSGSPAVPVSLQPGVFPHDALVIEFEPIDVGSAMPVPLFTAGWPLDIRVSGSLLADGQGGFSLAGVMSDYRLVVQGPLGRSGRPSTPSETDSAAILRALALPDSIDSRIAEIAVREAGEGSVAQRIERLSDWLRRELAYTRRPGDVGIAEPLSVFLFERKAGHCEYFATALAMMSRSIGIPARIVNGFVGGSLDPETGWWTVRRSDAHTWVEYHDGGWVLADPTPGPAATTLPTRERVTSLSEKATSAWEDGVLAYDRRDQFDALFAAARGAESWLARVVGSGWLGRSTTLPWRGLLLLGSLAFIAALLVRIALRSIVHRLVDPETSEPHGPIARVHHRAREHVVRCGYAIPSALPPIDAARWLSARVPGDASDALQQLAWLYYGVHLGGDDPAPRISDARALLDRVRALTPREETREQATGSKR